MADEFYDLFNQLFYSTDVWGYLGIAIIIGLFLLLITRVKEFTPISFIILSMWGIHYIGIMAEGGYFVWHSFICFAGAIFTILLGVQQWYSAK